jgi:TetR/AcrR family transcriptional regulator
MLGMRQARLPGQDRREQILGVAMDLFAHQGFRGTTTRQIAQASGVNEAIIFRHFPRKQDLYWAVIEQKCRDAGQRKELLRQRLSEHKPDREIFAEIAEDLLNRHRGDPSRSRLLLFTALENHQLSERFFQTYIAKYYEVLAEHIALRIGEGAFRPVDPLLAARGFLGMVVYHFWIQDLFGGKRHQKFDPHQVCQTLADIWLRGVQPGPEKRNGNSRNGNRTHASNGSSRRSGKVARHRRKSNHLNLENAS